MQELHEIQLDPIVTNALKEDWGYGDWTTDICIESDVMSRAQIICKEDCVVAGLEVVRFVFKKVDPELKLVEHVLVLVMYLHLVWQLLRQEEI